MFEQLTAAMKMLHDMGWCMISTDGVVGIQLP